MTRAVHSERVRTLYRQSLPVLGANVVNAAIVTVALWPTGPRPLLLGWSGAMVVMALVRLALNRSFRRAEDAAERPGRWGARFVVGSAVAGVLWGAAGALFFDAGGTLSRVLFTFVIGGMGAAAAGTLACYPPAFFAYLIPSLLPLTVRLAVDGDRLSVTMAALVGVYGLALSAVARISQRALVEAYQLRFDKERLLAELEQARQTLEETNQSLERRVAERTTELEQQGEALREAQRMEAVGRLAGGVAHDFNNLLTVVLANITVLQRERPLEGVAHAAVEDIHAAAIRGAELVRQLLAFSRRQKVVPRVIDLNRLVADAERLLARLIGETVELRMTLAEGPLPVKADRGQLEQVLINLVTNARDAMPGGGVLVVSTSKVMAEGDADVPAGAYAVLSVTDTGIGMDRQTRERAFEPFFTTKEVGRGTGLGLATVYGIVSQSGGRVTVHSAPGQGSGFDVHLPITTEKDTGEHSALLAGAPAGGMVLLAEDEPQVRAATAQMLHLAGYQVITARDGDDALARARAFPGPIDVLVADVVMRQMGGVELARQLLAERPALRVLFISGYPAGGAVDALPPDLGAGADFLHKPFTFQTLTSRLARLLGGASPAVTPRGARPQPGG